MVDDTGSRRASAYRLWLRLIETEARVQTLQSRLSRMENSKSWRITAPLRALMAKWDSVRLGGPQRQALQPVSGAEIPTAWQPVFANMTRNFGLAPGFGGDADAPRCLVDVTELALEDLRAGVQRVTRRWLSELLVAPPEGYSVEPVRLSDRGQYVLARRFLAKFLGSSEDGLGKDSPLQPRADDVFLGLDFCRDRASALDQALASLQGAGVDITLLLPDMLPLQHPEWFPSGISAAFDAWLEVCIRRTGRVICISQDSADALQAELDSRKSQIAEIVVVPLGADLPPSGSASLPARRRGVTRLLMVGTVEPRKCYPQAIDAFEALLARGALVDLLIIGHRGWESEALIQRILRHPEAGQRLHWLDDADDATLAAAYRDSDLLVMASAGEGYGLPIGEAAYAGCRLLLRDIPVFREVAGGGATYFSGAAGTDLARAISSWIDQPQSRRDPGSKPWPTWQYSAFSLKNETIARSGSRAYRPPTT